MTVYGIREITTSTTEDYRTYQTIYDMMLHNIVLYDIIY